MKRTWNQKIGSVACSVILLALAADASAKDRHRRHSHDQRHNSSQARRSVVERWTTQLVDELDHLQEDLYYERVERRLLRDAEKALEAAVHFQQVLRRGADRDHLIRDFRELDKQVHDLVKQLSGSRASWLRRASLRVQYAQEQLQYYLAAPDAGDHDTFRQLVARHAHILEQESQRLEQLIRQFGNQAGVRNSLDEAIKDFADATEHFHEAVERDTDRRHLQRDFQELDQSWHNTVHQINRSPAGLWLRRQAQRVNHVHNQLHAIFFEPDTYYEPPRPDDGRRSPPAIEFVIPGLGRWQLR